MSNPTLQEIAESQGLTYVDGVGIYAETGDLLLQQHPDPDNLHSNTAFAIPEVVDWDPERETANTWSTVFAEGGGHPAHYYRHIDARVDAKGAFIRSLEQAPNLREVVVLWRQQAKEVKR